VVKPPTPDDIAGAAERLRAAGCVFAEDEAALLADAARSGAELEAMVARRVDGVPVEQIVGWAEFCGIRVVVEPGVFVPRRRTEQLARAAAANASSGSVVVDLCCGSGAVGLAVATMVPGVQLHAVDIDPAAVRCARRNLAVVGAHIYEGDLFRPLSVGLIGAVDIVTVNAPYVPTDQIPLLPHEARLHEPAVALDGGADGLDVHRRVAAGATMWLAPGGKLFAECSEKQAPALADIYAGDGSVDVVGDDETQTAIVTLTASRSPDG
jgi:release factor glutamine methyltransferase